MEQPTPQVSAIEPNDWLDSRIFIPVAERGRPMQSFALSVRLSNILERSEMYLLGDLNGKSYSQFSGFRNCGRKTLSELHDLVREIQAGHSQHAIDTENAWQDPNIICTTTVERDLVLEELPMSVRLENVLRTRGYKTVGDLHGCDIRELWKSQNCGRKTISELKELLRRAEAGEFTTVASAPTDPLSTVLNTIGAGMSKINQRDREIVKQRLFGRNGQPKTLEEIGKRFGMTRERVRQIVKGALEKVRRSGGPLLARALEALAKEHDASVVPITVPLVGGRLTGMNSGREWPELFYVYALDQMAPLIPVWGPNIGQETLHEVNFGDINSTLEEWLRAKGAHPTAKEGFEFLRSKTGFSALSVARLFSALRRARNIIVDLPRPDDPRLRLRRLRLFDITLPVLLDSSTPLTPEEILEKGRLRFGADAVLLSGRTAENALAAHPDIFRLGPRSFGLRQHFVSSEASWPGLRNQFIELLRKDNRPISTVEVFDKRSIALPDGVSSYELAEILRDDARLIDLGRRLFALAKWGVEEREHIKDLLPKVLSQADRPLTLSEMYEGSPSSDRQRKMVCRICCATIPKLCLSNSSTMACEAGAIHITNSL